MNEEKTFEGEYIGREFKEGTSNGSSWTKYTLKFKPKEGQQWGFQIPMFVPVRDAASLTVDKLVEGGYYKVVYTDSTNLNPRSSKPYKQFIRINSSDPNQTIPQSTTNQADLSKWGTFYPAYFKTCKAKNVIPTEAHMIGSYMKYAEPQYIQKLVNVVTVTVSSNKQNKPDEPTIEV